jgi:hypothetical protein
MRAGKDTAHQQVNSLIPIQTPRTVLDASGLDFTPGSYHCRVGALTTKPEKKVGKWLPVGRKKNTTKRFEHITSSQLVYITLHYPVQSGSVF